MAVSVEANEIVRIASGLPNDRVRQLLDFAHFIDLEYRKTLEIDESDEWSDEDLRDFTRGSKFTEEMTS